MDGYRARSDRRHSVGRRLHGPRGLALAVILAASSCRDRASSPADAGVSAPTPVAVVDAGGQKAPRRAPPPPSQYTNRPPLHGFADTHNHQFGHLAYGANKLIWGEASGDPQTALPPCFLMHQPGDHLERYHPIRCLNYGGHGVGGWPEFAGWPRWDTFTHQQVYETWLRRAHLGGLRLMVMFAVNSEPLCAKLPDSTPAPGRGCDDMENVDAQLRAAREFEERIDRQFGWSGPSTVNCNPALGDCATYHGERPGWYRLVYTAEQARETIGAGKLAVVLGVEVADLFGCMRTGCTKEKVTVGVQRLKRFGVRHVFPIHNAANAFGGPAIFNGGQSQASGECKPEVDVGEVRKCRGEGYLYERRWHGCANPVCGASTGSVHCSNVGLTGLGRHLVSTLMDEKMFVDLDHMSAYARSDALDIAEHRTLGVYPMVSGHTDFFDLSQGEGKSEATLKYEEIRRIAATGGMVSPIITQGAAAPICVPGTPQESCAEPRLTEMCGKGGDWTSSAEWARAYIFAKNVVGGVQLRPAVALGSDFNGMLTLPRPRFGDDGCFDQAKDGARLGRVQYPFPVRVPTPANPPAKCSSDGCDCVTPQGKLDKCKFGNRTFDLNTDGLSQVGLLPDFIEDARAQFEARFLALGESPADAEAHANAEVEPLLRSAEAYVLMWERIDGVVVRPPGDALEANDTLQTAKDSALATPSTDLTLHTSEDVDYFTANAPGCSTLSVVLRHDPKLAAPDVELLDAKGTPLRPTVTFGPDTVELKLTRANGRYHVRVSHAWPTVCRNGFDCGPELQEYLGVYHLSVNVQADANTGPEVCDGIDNDCNGLVDDCLATDPECADTDHDGRANCVDEDDDNDCVLDTKDNCRLKINANFACPQADKAHSCSTCARPWPVGQLKIIEGFLEACAMKPVKPICRVSGCSMDDLFGKGLGARIHVLREMVGKPSGVFDPKDKALLGQALARFEFAGSAVKVQPVPPTAPLGPSMNLSGIECASGGAVVAAGNAIQAMELHYRQCMAEAARYVRDGLCQKDTNKNGVGDVCEP